MERHRQGNRRWIPLILVSGLLLVTLLVAAGGRSPSDFVEIQTLDPTIRVELPYATENNFTKRRLYPVERCYLRREVAEALVKAHQSLQPLGVGLKIWDGYRPRSVQYRMWEAVPEPGYVGDPKRGSKHNRGAAVDLTLFNLKTGEELEMPTGFDVFSLRAHSAFDALPHEVLERRKLLQDTMRAHGFTTISKEWWHFDYRGWENFALEDIAIEELVRRDAIAAPDPAPIEIHGPPKPVAPVAPSSAPVLRATPVAEEP